MSRHTAPGHGYDAHETACIDEGAVIGEGTRIWHFSHIMPDTVIGRRCNLGQNVVVSPGCRLGDNVKVQNNVSIYTGVVIEDDVFCGPSMVFTNVINPRSHVDAQDEYQVDAREARRLDRRQRHDRLRPYSRPVLLHRRWCRGHHRRTGFRSGVRQSGAAARPRLRVRRETGRQRQGRDAQAHRVHRRKRAYSKRDGVMRESDEAAR